MHEGFEIILAVGGDGTIAAVASALRSRDASLGIIPLGTFNYFARSLDVPTDITSAVRLLSSGARRPMRVGDINGRIYLNNASLDADTASFVESQTRCTVREDGGWGFDVAKGEPSAPPP